MSKETNTYQHTFDADQQWNKGITFYGASGPLLDQRPCNEHAAL